MKKLLTDARFIILLFFLLRLYGITNPPLERNHNWRQATTNMYARNFLEVDNNILYSRVDMAGDLSGITIKEFPLFNYCIYLAAEAFGWQHWYGRLISLVVSSFGVWFFFLIVKKYVDERLALSATLVLLCSIWFGHSRIIMPDTFAVSLVLGGLFFGLEWLYKGNWWRLLLFFGLGTAGAMSKLPAGFLLSILVLPVFQKMVPLPRKISLAVAGSTLLAICGWWYFFWLPQVIADYGYEHYPMRSVSEGAREILANLPETFERFYVSALKSYMGFGLFVAGVVMLFWKREGRGLLAFGVLSLTFLGYMFKSGASFYHHNYYIIPYVPVMAVVAAYALHSIKNGKFRVLLLLAFLAESIGNQQDAFRVPQNEFYKLSLEPLADSLSHRSDLVAFFDGESNPQELYFAHRKGWVLSRAQLLDPVKLADLSLQGCHLVFINRKNWGEAEAPPLPLVFENEHYRVFGFP